MNDNSVGGSSRADGGSGHCEHGSTGPCPECDGCPKCDQTDVELVDTSMSDWTEYGMVCGWCIKEHGDRMAREGERGQGQRSIGEQHAVERERGRWREQ